MTIYTDRDIPRIIWRWMKIFNGKGYNKLPPYWPTPCNDGLRFLSPFTWLLARRLIKNQHVATDRWAFRFSLLSIFVFLFYALFSECIGNWAFIPIAIGMLRVLEIFVVQAGVMIFDRYQRLLNEGKYAVRSLHRIALLLIHNYVEIIFWFALVYRFLQVNSYNIDFGKYDISTFPDAAIRVLHFSFFTMTTFGEFNDITSVTVSGWSVLLILAQATMGLYMALLILARFIGSIPIPKSEDNFEVLDQ